MSKSFYNSIRRQSFQRRRFAASAMESVKANRCGRSGHKSHHVLRRHHVPYALRPSGQPVMLRAVGEVFPNVKYQRYFTKTRGN